MREGKPSFTAAAVAAARGMARVDPLATALRRRAALARRRARDARDGRPRRSSTWRRSAWSTTSRCARGPSTQALREAVDAGAAAARHARRGARRARVAHAGARARCACSRSTTRRRRRSSARAWAARPRRRRTCASSPSTSRGTRSTDALAAARARRERADVLAVGGRDAVPAARGHPRDARGRRGPLGARQPHRGDVRDAAGLAAGDRRRCAWRASASA